MVNLDGQPDRNDWGDTPLGVSVGPSQGGLTETGRLVSNVNSIVPGAGVLDYIKMKEWSPSIQLSASWVQEQYGQPPHIPTAHAFPIMMDCTLKPWNNITFYGGCVNRQLD